eukprot:14693194-Alexandrium_andersonii.AAC.1
MKGWATSHAGFRSQNGGKGISQPPWEGRLHNAVDEEQMGKPIAWRCGFCHTPHVNRLCMRCRVCGKERDAPKMPNEAKVRPWKRKPWVRMINEGLPATKPKPKEKVQAGMPAWKKPPQLPDLLKADFGKKQKEQEEDMEDDADDGNGVSERERNEKLARIRDQLKELGESELYEQ